MNNYVSRLETIQLVQVEKNKFAITCNEKIYFVSSLMFDLFQNLKQGYDLATTRQKMNSAYANLPNEHNLHKIVEDNIERFLAAKTPEQIKANSYINFQTKLFQKESLASITKFSSLLFNRYVFIVLFSASAYWSTLLFKSIVSRGALFSSNIAWTDGLGLVLISYLFLISLAVFHEIGHASATYKYGIKAKEIGFGFYLFFPVLFTNVSEIWLLGRFKRIVINIGGIYFQLIINGILYLLLQQGVSTNVISSLFITNSILILYSLNPFMRNDGYWIFSDLFDIPNLSATAFDYPLRFIHFLKGRIDTFHPMHIKSTTQRIALAVYASAMYFLIFMLPLGMYDLTINNYEAFQNFLKIKGSLHGAQYYEAWFKLAKTFIFYALLAFFTYRMFKMIVNKYKTI